MSTRSIIAIEDGGSWKGRYCHSDGYCSHNGRIIFNEIKKLGTIQPLVDFLSDDGPGSHGISHISEGFLTEPREMKWSDGFDRYDQTNFRVYKGREGDEGDTRWLTPADADCFHEWIYVINEKGMRFGPTTVCEPGDPHYKESVEDYNQTYKFRKEFFIPWNTDEPDWGKIEDDLYAEAAHAAGLEDADA